jgi:hypothetical protein
MAFLSSSGGGSSSDRGSDGGDRGSSSDRGSDGGDDMSDRSTDGNGDGDGNVRDGGSDASCSGGAGSDRVSGGRLAATATSEGGPKLPSSDADTPRHQPHSSFLVGHRHDACEGDTAREPLNELVNAA